MEREDVATLSPQRGDFYRVGDCVRIAYTIQLDSSPIGLILCSEGNTEHIEYLMLDEQSPIKVAQYYTQLPDKKILAERLQRAIAIAREHYAENNNDKL